MFYLVISYGLRGKSAITLWHMSYSNNLKQPTLTISDNITVG